MHADIAMNKCFWQQSAWGLIFDLLNYDPHFKINSNIPLIQLYVGQISGNLYLPEYRDSKVRKKASEEGSRFKAHALYSLERGTLHSQEMMHKIM